MPSVWIRFMNVIMVLSFWGVAWSCPPSGDKEEKKVKEQPLATAMNSSGGLPKEPRSPLGQIPHPLRRNAMVTGPFDNRGVTDLETSTTVSSNV